jgi:hypothetical protein
MFQGQRQLDLVFLEGKKGVAVATGNNASWLCPCGYELPLIGRSGVTRVACPDCNRKYLVISEDNIPLKRVLHVIEIK